MSDESQRVEIEHHDKIQRTRVAEARSMSSQMIADGVTGNSDLEIDFKHVGVDENSVRKLYDSLTEECGCYVMTMTLSRDRKTWLLDCTTRPHGVDGMVGDALVDWCIFMCHFAKLNACVFRHLNLLTQNEISNGRVAVATLARQKARDNKVIDRADWQGLFD